jgi:hypothetical protein
MEKSHIYKNAHDFTEFSVLKDLDMLDKKPEHYLKRKNESELDFEMKEDLIEFHSKTGLAEFEEIDYELFKQNLEKENFQVQFQNYVKKEENLNKSNQRKRFLISEKYQEFNSEENEEKEEDKSKEDFIPWILVVVGSLICISATRKAFME